MDWQPYLRSTTIVDWETPTVHAQAQALASVCSTMTEIAKACFEWVRDEIQHSGDSQSKVTTCRASAVLAERTGWCFAKSHLLAALLRANAIPTGFCYQRLRDGERFTLHGLNAVHLPDFGWYRIDARGNKPGVDAQFCPPEERLAWPVEAEGEADLPDVLADPLPKVVDCLHAHSGWEEVQIHLPDVLDQALYSQAW